MELQTISLDDVRKKRIAILGYGNQGRAHALNLRDSGVQVSVGVRPGKGADSAKADGFQPQGFLESATSADVVMFLLPDQVIPEVYASLRTLLTEKKKTIGFAHGYVYHFKTIELLPECSYFLAAPKGAGALLRAGFQAGGGLPGAYAFGSTPSPAFRAFVLSYCKAIGIASSWLIESSFQLETEGDLFGEQSVLCGGLMELMEASFEVLVKNGHPPETAFFDCCFEARMILELWMKFGPAGLANRISPTAFYGGLSRGKRVVTAETKRELENIFQEIRSGEFTREWKEEVEKGMPTLSKAREKIKSSLLQTTYDKLSPNLTK